MHLLTQEFKRIGSRLRWLCIEWVPIAMDHHSLGCLPAEKFPTFASGRQGRGATTLSGSPHQFHLTTLHEVGRTRLQNLAH
jgi:hypothetical protein